MRVLATGAGGFLGGALVARLEAGGHTVMGTSSRHGGGRWSVLAFGQAIDTALFDGVDVVVHLAHDLAPGSGRRTVEGTLAIARAATSAGVSRQVYVSSFSAHAGARTEYGRTKRELESYFLPLGHAVVRPGLVVGRGGMFGRMAELVRTRRVVPMVYPNGPIAVVAEADCIACLVQAVEGAATPVLDVWNEHRVTMRHLLMVTRAVLASRCTLVPVPYLPALGAAMATEALGIRTPLQSDALRAMRANARHASPGNLRRFVQRPATLEQMVTDALR